MWQLFGFRSWHQDDLDNIDADLLATFLDAAKQYVAKHADTSSSQRR